MPAYSRSYTKKGPGRSHLKGPGRVYKGPKYPRTHAQKKIG